ncbi:MAG TPA: hypothetical protein VMS43_16745 [Allosphingosinicella sp.]|nr:hypothetical protein [Allosphingosinicella sp.]
MSGLLLAAMLAAAQQQGPPSNVVFARGHLDGWSMQATNVIDHGPTGPTINRMLCEIEREGVRVTTWRQGNISFIFEGGAVPRGGRVNQLLHSGVRALMVDQVSYDVERRDLGALTDRYTDVVYPETQPVYPPSGFFFLAVRRRGSDLWLHTGNITNELIEARRLRIGYRHAGAGPMLWIEVPLTGLPEALNWCHAAMASPDALRLNPS